MQQIAGFQTELIPPAAGSGAKATERWLVSRDQLATILDLKGPTVNKLVEQGMPKHGHGRYDLAACVQWYVDTWRVRANEKAPTETSERKRYDAARADQAELDLAQRRRELLPVAEVTRVLNEVAAILVGALEAFPARRAADLAGLDTPGAVRALLTEEMDGIRVNLATALTALGVRISRRRAADAPPKKKRRPVGGRKKDPPARK